VKGTSHRLNELALTCDDLDQYSRNINILMHGVPQSPGATEQNLTGHVVDLLNTNLGISLQEQDLVTVHRLGRAATTSATSSQSATNTNHLKPSPIILQFASRKQRNDVQIKRKFLKGKGFSLTEQLTQRKSLLLKKANQLVADRKIQSAWSHEGRILVKSSNRTILITSEDDLTRFQ